MPEDREARYIGLVHGYDAKPKRRLFDLLKMQGLQANQDVTFLTDGGEEIRTLTERITPEAEHVLDWFHIAMRVTVLEQYARGIGNQDEAEGQKLLKDLERVKWLLWHGNQHRAGRAMRNLRDDVESMVALLDDHECKALIDRPCRGCARATGNNSTESVRKACGKSNGPAAVVPMKERRSERISRTDRIAYVHRSAGDFVAAPDRRDPVR